MRLLHFALLFWLAQTFVIALGQTTQPSPLAYIGNPTYRSLALSPDGKYAAAAQDLDAERSTFGEDKYDKKKISLANVGIGDQIVIFELATMDTVRIIDAPNQSVYGLSWASNDRVLAFVSAGLDLRLGRGYTLTLPATRTLSIDWRKGEITTLFDSNKRVSRTNFYLSSVVDPLPNDPDHVLMAAYKGGDLDLWRVNILTGDSNRVEAGSRSTFAWLTNIEGKPTFRLDQSSNGRTLRVFAKAGNGRWKKIISTRLNEKGEAPQFWPIGYGEHPNEMYVLSETEGEPRATIKIYDLTTGTFTKTVASHPKYDIAGGVLDPNTGLYFGSWHLDDRYQAHFNSPQLQRHYRAVQKFFDDDANVRIQSISRNLEKIVFNVSSPTMPSDLYLYDVTDAKLDPLFSLHPDLTSHNLSSVEITEYEARDGIKITGYITHPRNRLPTQTAPLIVMPHGGPASRDYYKYDAYAQFLANRGYRVFQPNFRGSSGYGIDFKNLGHREWGGKMHDDIMDGVKHLQSRGLATKGHACIVGASYGGYEALYSAMTEKEEFKCAVSIAGVSDLIDIVNYVRRGPGGNRDAFEQLKTRIGDPKKDRAKLIAKSPARNIEKLTTPLLIIHGKRDRIVPYAQSYDLMESLDKAEVKYEWRVFGDGHSFQRVGSHVLTLRSIESFLAKHLQK